MRDRGVTLRLVADYTQMMCKGSLAKKLLGAKVDVFVHPQSSDTMGHQYVVLDKSIIVFGAVNWTERTMVSGGVITIADDPRVTLPMLTGFDQKMRTCRMLELNEWEENATCCPQCIKHRARYGARANVEDESGVCVAE